MAEAKLGWILFQLLGWPIAITALFANIPPLTVEEPYKWIMATFGVLFMVVNFLRAREKWRREKMDNDDREFDLNIKHGKKSQSK